MLTAFEAERRTRTSIEEVLAMFTLQDALLVGYLLIAGTLVWRHGPSAEAEHAARRLYGCVACILLGCWVGRSPLHVAFWLRWLLYRAALAGVLLYSYLMLRDLLPLVRPDSVDDALLRLDVRIFGFEPSLWLERFNTRPIVEWFSFFYFSYFFICLTYLTVVVWLSPGGRQTAEFALGTLIVFCLGQIGYMSVPAIGPIRYLTSSFHGPLAGGFFWGCVWKTVEAGSAMKDVFPSLHTAVPSWFTLFAFHRARTDARWRWPARITAFFAANIIVSTMLLRWHYAVDVVAGLALATTAGLLAPKIAKLEEHWRSARGLPPVWALGKQAETIAPAE